MNHDHAKRFAVVLDKMAELAKSNAAATAALATMLAETAQAFRELTATTAVDPRKKRTFEVMCDGFSAEDDSTDDRVFWVLANRPEEVEHALLGTGAVFREVTLPESATIDFALPTHSLGLYEAARKFLKT